MENGVIEAKYPIIFRQAEARELGQHLKTRQSVVLIGMKRVGISNFLRFFIYHKDIAKTYIADSKKHLFIPVDLNDLVELEVFPFWTLTLKRVVDTVEKSDLGKEVKKKIETLFLDSIQSQDLFLTIDSVRKSLVELVDNGILPTLFFIRFDRMKSATTPEFFANLQGLKDATSQKLSYVFTSSRSLDALDKDVFTKASLSVFSKDIYIKPAKREDTKIVFKTYEDRYKLKLSPEIERAFFDVVDGYVQYLQLALIYLHESRTPVNKKEVFFDSLAKDERIGLQSEELWDSLGEQEKTVLTKVVRKETVSSEDREKAKYLWDTGFLSEENGSLKIFSPLLDSYIGGQENKPSNHTIELTKKENILFNFLKENSNEICEREQIVGAVWPEVESLGVSDWAIDRLVARVRSKLKLQDSMYEIQTIKTRGYKLLSSERSAK